MRVNVGQSERKMHKGNKSGIVVDAEVGKEDTAISS